MFKHLQYGITFFFFNIYDGINFFQFPCVMNFDTIGIVYLYYNN